VRRSFALLGGWLALVSAAPAPKPVALDLILADTLPPKLSDFRFFTGPRADQPNRGVTPYDLNTPLFSDYTDKSRYVWMPPGRKARYTADGVFEFPVGTALIKTFSNVVDPRMHVLRYDKIETRLLLRRANGWVALPYVWNADRSDAELKRAGTRVPLSRTDPYGVKTSFSYAVPNVNQCKGCHDSGGAITPIGPKARNLNNGHQLESWKQMGLLDTVPANAPSVPRWDDPLAPVDLRARAYLDVNCGHCHNRNGPANTSGLWLDWHQPKGVNLGFGKRPTAAGRGSGDLEFAITPGHPEKSYLIYRMQSLDPGIAMPELGRAMVHKEGVALLSEWITAQK
jgi:uncharacterized repeat protein (TIGR03806 family)